MDKGGGLEDAMKRQGDVFPPLMTAMASVGEQTGMLPEVFTELEKYYARQQQLRRLFLALTAWPLIQFIGAVFVLAGLIFIFGLIPQGTGKFALHFDPLGLGMSGTAAPPFPRVGFRFSADFVDWIPLIDPIPWRQGVCGRPSLAHADSRPLPACLGLGPLLPGLRLTLETGMPIARACG